MNLWYLECKTIIRFYLDNITWYQQSEYHCLINNCNLFEILHLIWAVCIVFMFIKTFKKSFKSFLAHSRTPLVGWRRIALAIHVGEYGWGKIKAQTGPGKKFFFLLTGIPAGKEFSTGPDWPVCRSGYNSGSITAYLRSSVTWVGTNKIRYLMIPARSFQKNWMIKTSFFFWSGTGTGLFIK